MRMMRSRDNNRSRQEETTNTHRSREENENRVESSSASSSSWRMGGFSLYNAETDGEGVDVDDEVEEILFGGGTAERSENREASNYADRGEREERASVSSSASNESEASLVTLASRLRCVFAMLTVPLIPLGTALSLLLLLLLYDSLITSQCAHPLRLYALVSLVLFAYTPQHRSVKLRLFNYSRARDGPVRPNSVRLYDQLFHLVCLLYLYSGMMVVKACDRDRAVTEDHLSTCTLTCPHLYKTTQIFVLSLQLFTVVLVLPLLCLPCVYAYILRSSSSALHLARLRSASNNIASDDDSAHTDSLTTQMVLDHMDQIKIFKSNNAPHSHEGECCICMVDFHYSPHPPPSSSSSPQTPTSSSNDDGTSSHSSEDRHSQCHVSISSDDDLDQIIKDAMAQQRKVDDTAFVLGVQTKCCKHVFHRNCLGTWIAGGRWSSADDGDYASSSSSTTTSGEDNAVPNESTRLLGTNTPSHTSSRTRRGPSRHHRRHRNGPISRQTQSRPAKRRTCPHCRADLTPTEPSLTTASLARHDDLTSVTRSISPIRSDGHEATASSLSLGVERPQSYGGSFRNTRENRETHNEGESTWPSHFSLRIPQTSQP